MNSTSDWQELSRQVAELCVRTPATAGPEVLARELAVLAPGLTFRQVLSRGGWYRLGGVVDANHVRLSDNLETWAEQQLAAHDEDMAALCDDYAEDGLRATRLTGRTRYFVAATGGGATDFVQIEIEELQEVVCHPLFAAESLPSGIEELIDPRGADVTCCAGAEPIGSPFLVLRRLTPVAAFLARMRVQKPEAQPIHRFVEAWEASSASAATQFSNHWVVVVREHLDRYRQAVLHATPVAALNGAAPQVRRHVRHAGPGIAPGHGPLRQGRWLPDGLVLSHADDQERAIRPRQCRDRRRQCRFPLPARSRRTGGQGVALPALRLLTALSLVARFAAAQAGAIVRLMSPPPSRVSCRVV
jgi:hypothetical protein